MNERVQLQRKETGRNLGSLWMATRDRTIVITTRLCKMHMQLVATPPPSTPSSCYFWVMGQLVWLDWRPENLKPNNWTPNTPRTSTTAGTRTQYSVLQYELMWLEFLCRCRWRTTDQSHRSSRRLCNCAPTCLPLCSTEYSPISEMQMQMHLLRVEASRNESNRVEWNGITYINPTTGHSHCPSFVQHAHSILWKAINAKSIMKRCRSKAIRCGEEYKFLAYQLAP